MITDENIDEITKKIKNIKDKIIIYPFVKTEDGYSYEKIELKNIPKIFKNSHQVTELIFNDTYMVSIDDLPPSFFRRERNLVYSCNNILVESIADKKVDDKCFPILKKYNYYNKYKEYYYNLNENIICYIKEDKTLRFEIFKYFKNQINIINDFLTSNII